jgi:DNA (cytosine-5)-methyltransferase 1
MRTNYNDKSIEEVRQENMRSIELFAGIGGIALAAEWAGIETVAFCEREPFCQKVLNKHWPDVPIFDDVRTLNKDVLEQRGIKEIDLISGGFPCQPYSIAGKKQGSEDERALWDEMFRIIKEIRPRWVVGENVDNFTRMDDFEKANANLESIGYQVESFIIPASAVGAPHRRNRVFMVGYSFSESELQTDKTTGTIGSNRETRESIAGKFRGKVARTYWQANQPPICGMDDGISKELDKNRLIALGNAVVPQQIYPVFKTIMEIERMKNR